MPENVPRWIHCCLDFMCPDKLEAINTSKSFKGKSGLNSYNVKGIFIYVKYGTSHGIGIESIR